jgi:hypothetical protein
VFFDNLEAPFGAFRRTFAIWHLQRLALLLVEEGAVAARLHARRGLKHR